MKKSTRKRSASKPAKPSPDFPLWTHPSGRWCKKVRGRAHYFGKVADDPNGQAALERWLAVKDYLLAGRTPPADMDGLTVRNLLNHFLTAKQRLLDNGEIVRRTFNNQERVCKRVHDCFGGRRLVADLGPEDFARLRSQLTKTFGPVELGITIQAIRSVFKWGHASRLMPHPVVFGPDFKGPSRKVIRAARHEKGPRMFEADELRTILGTVTVPLRAMTLLGVNAALGNHDVGALKVSALDLPDGWLNYPRAKTGAPRRCPLWPETVKAITEAMNIRPEPNTAGDSDLVFVTQRGNRWVRMLPSGVWVDSVSYEFQKWLKKLGLKRPGRNFYALRHTFETIGGESIDQVAVNAIMGHEDHSMAAAYRERISDTRLQAVVDHVRSWLFSDADDDQGEEPDVVPFSRIG